MGLKVTVQVDTSVPGGGRLRIVNQAVTGPPGPQGDPGPTGPQGPAGTAATIAVGTVTTVDFGDPATVTNSGTSSAAVFDFEIPEGEPGQGVPAHGTTGQILAKINNQSYNTEWVDPTPKDAQYVTLATNGTLTNERVLTAGTGITLNDGGAGAAVTVATTAILPTVVDAKGDLIVGTAADTVARLPVGATTGHVLTVDPAQTAGIKWAAAPGGGIPETLIDAKGDLIVGSAADTAARLAVGTTNEHGLIVDSSATNGITWGNLSPVMMRRVATYYYNGVPFDSGPAASTSTAANRMTFFPFYNPHKHTYSAAAVQVINNVAASNCRMGIYNDANGEPGTLVIDFGAVSTATSGAKEIGSSVTLSRGFYWAALLLDTAAVTFRTVGQANNFTLGRTTNAAVNPTFGGLAVVTYGALPDPAPSAVLGQAFTAGCIYLKA